jgi:UDP-hydrolysing UDP-N-acetyl-D-glucosamine 2-epimerase
VGTHGSRLALETSGEVMRRKICIILTTRGNYAKMKSTMRAVIGDPRLELQVVLAGGILIDRYGDYSEHICRDGFAITERVPFLMGGDSLESMTMSAGLATLELSRTFARLRPDVAIVIADRYEALSVAHAAVCMNIAIAHLEGGEISGSIDERIRHAITKLAHIHFPATLDAAERIKRMGEPTESVIKTGTPSLDLLAELDLDDISALGDFLDQRGVGDVIGLEGDYVVVSQHPVVTENESAEEQLCETLEAVSRIGMPVIWILPNMDAGESSAAVVLAQHKTELLRIRVVSSLPMELYARLLKRSRCLVGNSSSGIRECEYLGVPVVNIGTRQNGRQRGRNVLDVGHDVDSIFRAINHQLDHGRYSSDFLYGDGNAGQHLAEALATMSLELDKRMTY